GGEARREVRRNHHRWAVQSRSRLLSRQLRTITRNDDRRRSLRLRRQGTLRHHHCRSRSRSRRMIKVFVPRDAAALSMGADAVAKAIAAEAKKRNAKVEIVRNGSRGMLWLEPLVEVETPKGRVAYGPVKPADVPSLFKAKFLNGETHKLSHGLTD